MFKLDYRKSIKNVKLRTIMIKAKKCRRSLSTLKLFTIDW